MNMNMGISPGIYTPIVSVDEKIMVIKKLAEAKRKEIGVPNFNKTVAAKVSCYSIDSLSQGELKKFIENSPLKNIESNIALFFGIVSMLD